MFSVGQRMDPECYFCSCQGGPEKFGNQQSQTDGPPPDKKDSSLNSTQLDLENFFTSMGSHLFIGGPECFQLVKGGTQNVIFALAKGGQKNLETSNHKQMAPLPIKKIAPLTQLSLI